MKSIAAIDLEGGATENERYRGGAGNDLVDGGKGTDTASLGSGDDTFGSNDLKFTPRAAGSGDAL